MYLLVDSINGFLVSELNFPSIVSVAYKQLLLLCLFAYSTVYSPIALRYLCVLFSVFTAWAMLRFVFIDDIGFIHAFQEGLKVIYFFAVLSVLTQFVSLNELTVYRVVNTATATVVLNIILSLVGFGTTSYGDFGAKGFFYGGNALSGIVVLTASVSLARSIKKSFIRYIATSLFFMLIAALIGTKSGILGVFIAATLIATMRADIKTFIWIFAYLGALTIAFTFMLESISNSPLFTRMEHFYEQGGVQRLLFSGREEKYFHIVPYFLQSSLSELLLGFNAGSLEALKSTRTEFDVVDMFVLFGSGFCFVVFLSYCYVYFRLTKNLDTPIVLAANASFIVLIFIATIAGHVLFNGVVTPFWGFICAAALNLSIKKDIKVTDTTSLK
nr:O-antigen ligase family protein [Alteromonas facilis]